MPHQITSPAVVEVGEENREAAAGVNAAAGTTFTIHLPRRDAGNPAMTDYHASITWQRAGATFTDNRYRRAHTWTFDEGLEVPASSSPHSVPLPLSEARAVDPEEALVAAVSSCHMLWFLSLAAKRGIVVEHYEDQPVGTLGRNAAGKEAITLITLRPRISFGSDAAPSADELSALHHESHELCCLAHSVTAEVRCEPR